MVFERLRMVAVLLVAWMHAGQPLAARHLEVPDLGMFGVDIFFVISGFILSFVVLRSSPNPGFRASLAFLRRRAIRIYPLYWIFAAWPFLHAVRHREGLLHLPAVFLLPGFRYPGLPTLANFSWTLIFEMFFYLLLGTFLLVFAQRNAVLAMLTTLGALVLTGIFVDIRHSILIVVMNPLLLEFAMGACASLIYRHLDCSPRLGWSLLALGVASAFAIRILHSHMAFEMDILTNHGTLQRASTWGLSAALIVLGVVLLSPRMESPLGKLTVMLGNASYSTYLLSGFLLLRFGVVLTRGSHLVSGRVSGGLFQFLVTLALMALGLAFYMVIEKRLISAANRLIPKP